MKPILTATQVAVELGITSVRVRQLILAGRLRATKIGPIWLIAPRDIEAVRVRRPGRPRLKSAAAP